MANPANSLTYNNFTPGDESALRGGVNVLQQHVQSAIDAARNATAGYRTDYSRFTPGLNTEFKGPQFSNQLDDYSQQVVAQQQGANANRLATQQSQFGRQFAANPLLAKLMGAQASANNTLGQNGNYFQAAGQQRDRQVQEYQLQQQAQSSTNSARAQQSQLGADFMGLQNAALGQQAQLAAAPAQLQQNLIAILGQMAQAFGTQNSAVVGSNEYGNMMDRFWPGWNSPGDAQTQKDRQGAAAERDGRIF